MIHTIEKRNARCEGSMISWYEVREYTHRTPIGILANGKTIAEFKTKKEAYAFYKPFPLKAIGVKDVIFHVISLLRTRDYAWMIGLTSCGVALPLIQ